MTPFFSREMAQQHIGDLRRVARVKRVPDDYPELDDDGLTVRAATARDREAVRLLAALEGVQMPKGRVLVAEVRGDVVAALPLDGGRALADPFKPAQHLVPLLELRAHQLRGVLRAA